MTGRSTLLDHQLDAAPDSRQPSAQSAKILIHGINYAPELIGVGRYTRDFAEYLVTKGHAVEVVTAPPHYPGWWVRPPYRAYRYSREILNGVKVNRCPLFLHKSGQGFWRLLTPLSFAIAAAPVVAWRILRSRPDVVVCIEPTLFSAPMAVVAAKIAGARRVLHVQDLEIDAAFAVGHLGGDLFKRVALAFERIILRQFDTIVTISERMRDRLLQKLPAPDRISVIRNWVDVTHIKRLTGPNSFRSELGLLESDFIVLYAGQIGAKQALHLLFEAAEKLAGDSRIHFVIAGDGPLKAKFVDRYGGLSNIHFLPLQPEEKLCELLNLADLHILPQDRGAADWVLPSKLGGILASGHPVLIQADKGTELYDLLAGITLIVPPGDVEALVDMISGAKTGDPDVSRYGEVAALFAQDKILPVFRDVVCALDQRRRACHGKTDMANG